MIMGLFLAESLVAMAAIASRIVVVKGREIILGDIAARGEGTLYPMEVFTGLETSAAPRPWLKNINFVKEEQQEYSH